MCGKCGKFVCGLLNGQHCCRTLPCKGVLINVGVEVYSIV